MPFDAIVPAQRSTQSGLHDHRLSHARDHLPILEEVTTVQRLAAVAVLERHEPRLTVLQRIAVVDAAAYWVESAGGDELAWALLEAACRSSIAAGRTYGALLNTAGRASAAAR
ncbi:hypothetical protein [Cryptosporangium phraense]|uniref:Uncharacterized protein n=1 Tax=Cryptosporangium phraense TaxID=2593070 RepID=A0A545AXX2_9ACTN|nr:hypothetical protein [Cryptosporangium phraense]TQS46186.1 hypothetical protein FL583_06840 [Cryptosporangium phraense]